MGQLYSHSTEWEKKTAVILRIYGGRAILLLFYDEQDTESD